MKKISNPLTVIGMFAGIAEVAGTGILPFISEDLQRIFIWYVMGFPVLLVVAFFLTLNINSDVLYSPDDFKNEDNFMKLRENVAGTNEELEDIKEKVREKNPELASEISEVQSSLFEGISQTESISTLRYSEVIKYIKSKEEGVTVFELVNHFNVPKSRVYKWIAHMKQNSIIENVGSEMVKIGDTQRSVNRYAISKKRNIE